MIKRVMIFLCVAASLAVARADLVLRQHIESPMLNGTVTTQIKGNKIRVDMPASPRGPMSTIMDLKSGDSVTLFHQQKIAMKVSGAEIKQIASNMKEEQAGAATNAPAPAFHDTGRTEKVGNYNGEIYTWTSPDGARQKVWVAKNFPDYSKIKVQMDELDNSPVARLTKGAMPDISTLPGMVVKSQVEMNGQTITSTLISAKEEPVDASIFETPKGYQDMSQPNVKPAPTQ